MIFNDLIVFLASRVHWLLFLLILYFARLMLTLYSPAKTPSAEEMITITDDERERMKALAVERGHAFDRFYRFGRKNEPSLVLDDFLFLGNIQHATDRGLLVRFDIKHIINVCDLTLSETVHTNFNVIHISMPDEPQINIRQHFDRTNELLRGFYEKKERCLVHCAAGISRSATIVLAYLMKYHHNTLKDAFFFLMEKRPQIWPNEGFLAQLLRYETELIGTREVPQSDDSTPPKEENPLETLTEFENKHEKDE